MPYYSLKKDGGYYTVIASSSGVVQYRALRRMFCIEWMKENEPRQTGTQASA